MKKLRWGVLSTAKIGVEKVIPAMQQGEFCEVTAIASRDRSKAEQAAKRLKIARAYGSYEELLDDPEVDAIYNPLPNHLHVRWSIAALEAGKHVLCEKPIGLTVRRGAATGRRRQGTSRTQGDGSLHVSPPSSVAVKPRNSSPSGSDRGAAAPIQSYFSLFQSTNADDIRNRAEIGGGALMDIGCYCISLVPVSVRR